MELYNFINNELGSSTIHWIFLPTWSIFKITTLAWIILIAFDGGRSKILLKCSANEDAYKSNRRRPEFISTSSDDFYEGGGDRFLPGPHPPFPFQPKERPDNYFPVAFSASRAHPLARGCISGACEVVFENVLPISSGQFDRKSGVFRCQVPGLYFITFSGISTAHSSFRLALFHNDHEVISAYGQANGFGMASNSIILHLHQGHKVCLKLLEGELYESEAQFRAYTSFSGFLLQSMTRCCHPLGNGFAGFQGGHTEFTPEVEQIPSELGPRNSLSDAENVTKVEKIIFPHE